MSHRYLGFDLSERALKVAILETAEKQPPRLVGWHIHELSDTQISAGSIKQPKQLRVELVRALRGVPGRPLSVRYLVAALPEITTFLRAVIFPDHEPTTPDLIAQELERHIPLTADEAYFAAEPFSFPEAHGMILSAAPKQIVDAWVGFLEQTGWVPLALETEAEALLRAIVKPHDEAVIGILDLGATRAQLIVARGEIPLLSATLPFAGEPVIKHLGELMQWDRLQVLQHLTNCEQNAAECPTEWRKNFDEFASGVSAGTKKLLTSAAEGEPLLQTPPARFIVSGGMSTLPGLVEMLQKHLSIPTELANPLIGLSVNPKLKPNPSELGRLTVALGLALRGTGVFVPPPEKPKRTFAWPWKKKVKEAPPAVPPAPEPTKETTAPTPEKSEIPNPKSETNQKSQISNSKRPAA